jgi:hypothetical protein
VPRMAARLFTELAGQVGAAPGQAAALQQVQAALPDIRDAIAEAEAAAGAGIEGAIERHRRDEIDTLQELIAETREILRELRRQR